VIKLWSILGTDEQDLPLPGLFHGRWGSRRRSCGDIRLPGHRSSGPAVVAMAGGLSLLLPANGWLSASRHAAASRVDNLGNSGAYSGN